MPWVSIYDLTSTRGPGRDGIPRSSTRIRISSWDRRSFHVSGEDLVCDRCPCDSTYRWGLTLHLLLGPTPQSRKIINKEEEIKNGGDLGNLFTLSLPFYVFPRVSQHVDTLLDFLFFDPTPKSLFPSTWRVHITLSFVTTRGTNFYH